MSFAKVARNGFCLRESVAQEGGEMVYRIHFICGIAGINRQFSDD